MRNRRCEDGDVKRKREGEGVEKLESLCTEGDKCNFYKISLQRQYGYSSRKLKIDNHVTEIPFLKKN
jgi:hypothetical protein